jgi:hypothetical protein
MNVTEMKQSPMPVGVSFEPLIEAKLHHLFREHPDKREQAIERPRLAGWFVGEVARDFGPECPIHTIWTVLATQLMTIQRAGLIEQTALLAEAHRSKIEVNETLWHDGADWACDRIAEAIRALSRTTGA